MSAVVLADSDKACAGVLLTNMNISGSVVSSTSEQVVAVDSELVSHADAHAVGDAFHENSMQGTQYVEEDGILQGRTAREPVDRARYVVIDGNSGTMFACSRCSKQYIHRKSLNKHWNDKHVDDGIDRGQYLASGTCSVSKPHKNLFNVALVHCPSDVKHVALSCKSSPVRSAVHSSYALCSPTCSLVPIANSRQNIYSNLYRSETKHTGTIRDSVLWHSLAAIHSNGEHDLNSFYCAPMPAHIGGHYNGRASFPNQMFCDDDCQVLDLSRGTSSSDVCQLSIVSLPDAPLDLSLKSNSMCVAGIGRAASSLHGVGESVSKSATTYCKETSVVDSPVLNKPRSADPWVVSFGVSRSDSLDMLRRLHSGVLTNATNLPVPADADSDELKSQDELGPSTRYECYANALQYKNNLKMIAKIPDDLATSEETHNFFGGMSRGGHIRCKVCDFSATSMLLFSQHVARHVRKPVSAISDGVQNHYGDGTDKLENRFFMWLGLYRTDGADSDQKSSDGSRYAKDDELDIDENLESRCNAFVTDVSMPEIQANGFVGDRDGEYKRRNPLQKKNCSSYSVRQKPGCYQRGLGLTTTESRDAAGRSWRRRRLRTCERCGYVTDNLTTLKRHEVKHGALGMYRCKSCDYTVNQQHILEYHIRSVHGLSKKVVAANLREFKHNDVPLVDDECCGRNTATLVKDDHHGSLSETTSRDDSAVQGSYGMEPACGTCSSQVAKVDGFQCADNKCSAQKITSKIVRYPSSVNEARYHLLDAFGLQLGCGICVRCGFRSLSSVRMKRHMLRHPHERHACSLCPHTSLTAQLLLKHKRQHAECRTGYLAQKKTYQCPECPFIAASPHRLQCHTQFHGVKFRHVCGKCSYSVDRANLIAQHRRLHESASTSLTVRKRRWLHCSKCPFKTINSFTLANHKRGHYAINCKFMCSLCSFGTDVANVALGHERLHPCYN